MKLFDQRLNTIQEGLKNPKDNPCWKGYKPVGTKTKKGKTVPNCVPKESLVKENADLNDNLRIVVDGFYKYAIEKLGIQNPPELVLNKDKDRVLHLRSMAGYMPQPNKIWIYIGNRNAADIIRSIGHELVHAKQKESRPDGDVTRVIDGKTGSEDENEANSIAGVLLRTYGKINPDIYE